MTTRDEHFLGNSDGGRHTRLERVVRVDQENGGTAINFSIALKGVVFSVEEHDPAVGHGADHGDAELFSCQCGGGATHTTDVGGASTVDGGVDVVCTSRTHVCHTASLCRTYDAIGLRGDERLVVDLRE